MLYFCLVFSEECYAGVWCDAVFAGCHSDVEKIVELACKRDVCLIPYGGKFIINIITSCQCFGGRSRTLSLFVRWYECVQRSRVPPWGDSLHRVFGHISDGEWIAHTQTQCVATFTVIQKVCFCLSPSISVHTSVFQKLLIITETSEYVHVFTFCFCGRMHLYQYRYFHRQRFTLWGHVNKHHLLWSVFQVVNLKLNE